MKRSCSIPGDKGPLNDGANRDDDTDGGARDLGEKSILFFADPMCSWCWGFAPVLEQIVQAAQTAQTAREGARIEIVMGGLRPRTDTPWDAKMRAYIKEHWQTVRQQTGQPFDFSRFNDDAFVYDTLPACRAVVAARELNHEHAMSYYGAVQKAFYADGRDITKKGILIDIAVQSGYSRKAFSACLDDPQTDRRTVRDFEMTREHGVGGFPAVLCAQGGQYGFLTLGYRPFEALAPLLHEWLAS